MTLHNPSIEPSAARVTDSGMIVLNRRRILAAATTCGILTASGVFPASAQISPRKGGTLRLGMSGGGRMDSLDPRTYADVIPVACSLMIWNSLVEVDAQGNAVPELAESWESRPGATEWIFDIRKGITFGSGKTLDADDVVYSIDLVRKGPPNGTTNGLFALIKSVTKTSPNQIKIELSSGNADFPYTLADYHMIVVPAGTTDFSKADGTGAFVLTDWKPGIRFAVKRKPGNYWKHNCGNFDAVELQYLPDTAARMQALLTGQVDAINQVEPKTAALLAKRNSIRISRTVGTGSRFAFVAQTDKNPFANRDLLLAMKYGIDRQRIVDNVFSGYASIGNDHTVGPSTRYFDPNQEQRRFDPDKARFHLKKSGFTGSLELQVSEGAFVGATEAGLVFQDSAKQSDLKVDIKRVAGAGYWDKVWLKVPFCAVFWGAQPTADRALSQSFQSGAPWNDTRYANPKLDRLLLDARVELDDTKRRVMYAEAQALVADDAGMLCFAIGDTIDGCSANLMGLEPSSRMGLNDMRLAERGWFA